MGLSEGDALVGKTNILLFYAVGIEGPLFESVLETVSRANRTVRYFLGKFYIALNKCFNYEVGSPEKNISSYDKFVENWCSIKSILMHVISNQFSCKYSGNYDWPWGFSRCIVVYTGFEFNTRVDKNLIVWNVIEALVVVASNCRGNILINKYEE